MSASKIRYKVIGASGEGETQLNRTLFRSVEEAIGAIKVTYPRGYYGELTIQVVGWEIHMDEDE
jgi:RNA binding exosome subunit